MFELADEIGREHVRLLRALARTASANEVSNTENGVDARNVFCVVGDVKEKKLTDRQRQGIAVWAHGHSIPYAERDVYGRLEAVGFVASERHQVVCEGEQPEPDGTWREFAWTYKVEVTARGTDFMSRRLLRGALSLLPSKANKWVAWFLAGAAIVGSGWSWVSNLAALAD